MENQEVTQAISIHNDKLAKILEGFNNENRHYAFSYEGHTYDDGREGIYLANPTIHFYDCSIETAEKENRKPAVILKIVTE